jgi:hypothetical protein
MDKVMTGGCQCGAVRYEINGAPLRLYVCHCRECRRQSSSAFGISVIVRSADLRLVTGTLKRWSRGTDSGGMLHCFFCGDCGARVWHGDPASEATVSVKGGSLDDGVDLSGAVHIWTSRKLAGVVVPANARQYAMEPPDAAD